LKNKEVERKKGEEKRRDEGESRNQIFKIKGTEPSSEAELLLL
jgi:hypothetical protein